MNLTSLSQHSNPFHLSEMPEAGFREHLNEIGSSGRLQIARYKYYTLFVDGQSNVLAAIAAASFMQNSRGKTNAAQQATRYFVSIDNACCKAPASVKLQIALGSLKHLTSSKAKSFSKHTKQIAARALERNFYFERSCFEYFKKMIDRSQQAGNAPVDTSQLTTSPPHTAQWHTMRLTNSIPSF